jgi:hypothetical protein
MPSDETDDDSYNSETRLTHVKKAARDVEKKRTRLRTFELVSGDEEASVEEPKKRRRR